MGERAPTSDLSSTHGICEQCTETGVWIDRDAVERLRPLKELHRRLTQLASEGSVLRLDEELRNAESMGLQPIDLLVGVLQPALYELGALWERGAIPPVQEAKLTRFCERAIDALSEQQRKRLARVDEQRLVFLVAARGNAHTLGMKMLAFVLREQGMMPRVLPRTPSPVALRELCEVVSPAAVGISVALPEHGAASLELIEELRTITRNPPLVVVGGLGVDDSMALPAGVLRWRPTDGLLNACAVFTSLTIK